MGGRRLTMAQALVEHLAARRAEVDGVEVPLVAGVFAKAHCRRRLLACATSIGPGATNLVTAAAVAHVTRLPVLLWSWTTTASGAPSGCSRRRQRPGG